MAETSVCPLPTPRSTHASNRSYCATITASCDLDLSRYNREAMFNFAEHRRIEHCGIITSQTGEVPPGGSRRGLRHKKNQPPVPEAGG